MRLETQINKTSACNHWCRGCIAITPGPSYSQPIKHTSKSQEPMLETCAVCMHFKSLNKETIRLCTRFYVLMAALLWLSRWALSSSNLAPVCECTSSPFRKNLKLGTALTPHFLINACIPPATKKMNSVSLCTTATHTKGTSLSSIYHAMAYVVSCQLLGCQLHILSINRSKGSPADGTQELQC